MVEELIESVTIYADRLEVATFGMVPITSTPGEVGLLDPGTGSVVSEGRFAFLPHALEYAASSRQ